MKAEQLKQSIDDFTAAYNERATPFVSRKREAKGVQLRHTIVDLCNYILGLSFRLLPWSGAVLFSELIRLAREPKTGWSIGVYGAVAELTSLNHATPTTEVGEESLVLRTSGGALRISPPAGTRMFELVGATRNVERRVLALHRSRLRGIPAVGVTELGADEDAIEPTHNADRLFDLGVTRSVVRFCVRTGEPPLVAALRQANGLDPLDLTNGLVPVLLANSPDRILTRLKQCETATL